MRGALGDAIGRAAFRCLLRRGAVSVPELASDLGRPVEEIGAAVAELEKGGRIRLDAEGRVMGAVGLSVEPDRHRIDLDDGRTFWTWCAWDLLGIFGALHVDGVGRSTSPWSGASLEVRFRHGRPEPGSLVVFRPDDACRDRCRNLYLEWCSNINLFESHEAAEAWSERERMPGRALGLEEAADVASGHWEPLVGGLGR